MNNALLNKYQLILCGDNPTCQLECIFSAAINDDALELHHKQSKNGLVFIVNNDPRCLLIVYPDGRMKYNCKGSISAGRLVAQEKIDIWLNGSKLELY